MDLQNRRRESPGDLLQSSGKIDRNSAPEPLRASSLRPRPSYQRAARKPSPIAARLSTLTSTAAEAGFRFSVAITGGLMTQLRQSRRDTPMKTWRAGLWDVLWIASLSARRAKPGCSQIAFEVILHIEGTTKKYQTLILVIGPGDTPQPVITIGFPAGL